MSDGATALVASVMPDSSAVKMVTFLSNTINGASATVATLSTISVSSIVDSVTVDVETVDVGDVDVKPASKDESEEVVRSDSVNVTVGPVVNVVSIRSDVGPVAVASDVSVDRDDVVDCIATNDSIVMELSAIDVVGVVNVINEDVFTVLEACSDSTVDCVVVAVVGTMDDASGTGTEEVVADMVVGGDEDVLSCSTLFSCGFSAVTTVSSITVDSSVPLDDEPAFAVVSDTLESVVLSAATEVLDVSVVQAELEDSAINSLTVESALFIS